MSEGLTLGKYVQEVVGLPLHEKGDTKAHPVKTALHVTKAALMPTVTAYSDQIKLRGERQYGEFQPLEDNGTLGRRVKNTLLRLDHTLRRNLAPNPGEMVAKFSAMMFDYVVDLTVLTGPELWPIKATANAIAPALARGMARLTHGPLPQTSSEVAISEPIPSADKARSSRVQPPRRVQVRHP